MVRGAVVPEGYWTLVQAFAFYSEQTRSNEVTK